MLVLSRKPNERIVIGDDIVITVVRVNGGRISIGIEAPQDKKILRGELIEQPKPKPIVDMPRVFSGVRVA